MGKLFLILKDVVSNIEYLIACNTKAHQGRKLKKNAVYVALKFVGKLDILPYRFCNQILLFSA